MYFYPSYFCSKHVVHCLFHAFWNIVMNHCHMTVSLITCLDASWMSHLWPVLEYCQWFTPGCKPSVLFKCWMEFWRGFSSPRKGCWIHPINCSSVVLKAYFSALWWHFSNAFISPYTSRWLLHSNSYQLPIQQYVTRSVWYPHPFTVKPFTLVNV